jgi:EmrB/QacA subfamily drug resistance transporter
MNEENRKWWILAAMTTTVSMIFVDITVLPVVLPTIQREIQVSDLGLQWIINAYTLALAVFVLAGGKLGDRWGLKRSFCCGSLIFALSSAMCGLSHSETELILYRAMQGIGGALLLPATQAILISNFPPHQRGKALGLFVSIGSIFLAVGPLIGGSLTTYLSWHYVFWINLPIAAIGLLLALYAVPSTLGKKIPFDFRGFFILAVGIAGAVVALMQSQVWGWFSLKTIGSLLTGVFCLYWLFLRKHKSHASILDFELFKKKSFVASATAICTNQTLIMVSVFWAIYFQNILGFSPSKAGGFAFIANAPVLLAAPLGGYLVDRFGPRLPVMTGFCLITFGLSWFIAFENKEQIWLLLPTFLTFGFGISMIFTPSFVALMNEIPAEKRGSASGITTAMRQFSSSIGLALFGTMYSSIYAKHLTQSLQNSGNHFSPGELEGLLSKAPQAMKHLEKLTPVDAHYVLESARNAFLDAFTAINLTAATIAIIGIVLGYKLLKNTPVHR